MSKLIRLMAATIAVLASVGPAQATPTAQGPAPTARARVVLPDVAIPESYAIEVKPDAPNLKFTGHVDIRLNVRSATRTLTLNAAKLTFGKVSLAGRDEAPQVTLDTEHETATFTFASEIPAGAHTLSIDYAGVIHPHATGLFALDYEARGKPARALYTQFEAADARRFVPCWDEPAAKAVFTLSAVVPKDQMAISNTPEVSSERAGWGVKRVRFAPTPKMSSYLLFFSLGDFERATRKVGDVEIGVVTTRGNIDKAGYALDAAAELLPWFDEYFGVKYPLPKLDMLAAPGQSLFFGAMENWGAIFYFESALLVDPNVSTEADRRSNYKTVAHEMAHQWFGNLVTMAWWDDLWLNEGFASWMSTKVTDHFHPEWKPWLVALDKKEEAMGADAQRGTHPVIQPIYDVLQASQAFDSITYSKGEAVIRMLEDYTGADPFREGVRRYMKAHEYGNAVTDDLWRSLDSVTNAGVIDVAHDFTQQEGIPLVRVKSTKAGLTLTQARFAVDESGKSGGRWRIPVKTKAPKATEAGVAILSPGKPLTVKAQPGTLVNAGQAGYFRTHYDRASLARLRDAFATLSPDDQLGLLNDTRQLAYGGVGTFEDFLSLAMACTPQTEPLVLRQVVGALQSLDELYRGLPERAAFRAAAIKLVNPYLAALGWDEKPGESQNVSLLRGDVLEALGDFGEPSVLAEARRRFAALAKDPSSVTGNLRESVLHIVSVNADAATWDTLLSLARSAPTALEKEQFYFALARGEDPALAKRALDLALSNDIPVTLGTEIIGITSGEHTEMAFEFIKANLEAVYARLDVSSKYRFVPSIAGRSLDPAMIQKLDAFAEKNIPPTARRSVVKAKAQIAFRTGVRAKRLPQVTGWAKAHS